MTVPKSSAQTIVDLLNEAFKNGVKMTMKSYSGIKTGSVTMPTPQTQPVIKPKPMPVEEPHPISAMVKNRRK